MRFFVYLKYTLFFTFILTSSIVNATGNDAPDLHQNDSIWIQKVHRAIDSLKQLLNTQPLTEKQKLDICFQIAGHYHNFDQDSSSLYAIQSIPIAKKLKDYEKLMDIYIHIGVVFCFKGDFDMAHYYLNQLNELAIKQGNLRKEISAVKLIGYVYSQQGKFNLAIDYHLKCLKICETEGWTEEAGYISTLSNISEYYRKLGNTAMAIYFLKKAEKKCKELENVHGIATFMLPEVLNEFAFNYLKQNDLTEALLYAIKADNIGHAAGRINRCITKGLLATVYLQLNDYEQALKYAKESYEQAEILKDVNLYAHARKIVSDVYLAQKRYPEAEIEALKVWNSDSTNMDEARTAAENIALANIYMRNTEKAAYFLKKYSELNTQYSEKSFQTTVSDLSIKYETEKKELKINELESKRRLYILIALVSAVAMLLILCLLYFKQRLNKQKLKQLEQEKQLIVSQAVMDGEAAERTRLARDLHDGLGGMLSVVKLNLKDMKGYSLIENTDVINLNRAVEMLDKSIVELRRVSHHIMPDLSDGLKTPLEDFCRSISNANFRFFGDDSHLDNRLKITVYRCVHELINNAIKHARATTINVQLMIESNLISLSVQDDGTGFAPDKVEKGLGLENIRARVAIYNGKVSIFSSPEKGGTDVNIEIELA